MDVPATIRRIRAAYQMTQADTAWVLGVTTLSVSRWERGLAKPSPRMHQRIAALSAWIDKHPTPEHHLNHMGATK
jgi:DNA-binding transcriptional regulator YiaG